MHPSGLKHIRIVYHNLQHDGYGWPVEDTQDIDVITTPKTLLTINASIAGKLCKKGKNELGYIKEEHGRWCGALRCMEGTTSKSKSFVESALWQKKVA